MVFTPVSQEEQTRLLGDVLTRISSGSGRSAVVFDLDGTLHDNRPRTVGILNELRERWANAHPKAAEALRRLDPVRLGYQVTEALRQVGVPDALHAEALDHWKARFFVDDTLGHDVPLRGGVPFAKACYEAGANLVYLTGRDLPNMALGTFRSLRDDGYPIGVPGTELVLKPDFDMPDLDFKRSVIPALSRLGEVIATFDNEPGNCNEFHSHHPSALNFLLATQHAPNPPELVQGIHIITDFHTDL